MQEITLTEDLNSVKQHEVTIFKRQDVSHEFIFYGFIVDKESKIIMPRKSIGNVWNFMASLQLAENRLNI